jgi:hypothetical protein
MRQLIVFLSLLVVATRAAATDDTFTVLAKGCDGQNSAQACAAVGDYLWDNNGRKLLPCSSASSTLCVRPNEDRNAAVARVDELAYQFHERACGLRHAEACNKAGVYFAVKYAGASDKEAPALAAEAEVRFEKACKLGSREGCGNVGSTRPAK